MAATLEKASDKTAPAELHRSNTDHINEQMFDGKQGVRRVA